jgi:hypothetical protein
MGKARRETPQNRWTRDPVKEKYWREQIKLWQESGLSVRAFCKEHGVVETSFYAWRRELIVRARESNSAEELTAPERMTPNMLRDGRGRTIAIRFRQTDQSRLQSVLEKPSGESPFVPLRVVQDKKLNDCPEPISKHCVTVTTPKGYRISVSGSEDVCLVAELLTALEKDKC